LAKNRAAGKSVSGVADCPDVAMIIISGHHLNFQPSFKSRDASSASDIEVCFLDLVVGIHAQQAIVLDYQNQ
jgi:hypothetical protein